MIEQNLTPPPKWNKTLIFWGAALILNLVAISLSKSMSVLPSILLGLGAVAILGGLYGTTRLRSFLGPMKAKRKLMFLSLLILSYAATIGMEKLLSVIGTGASEHPAAAAAANQSLPAFLFTLFLMLFSMVGEEVLSALFTFPVWSWLKEKGLNSSLAFFLAAVFSSLIFGLSHLSVYNFNWTQCLLTIGLTRLPFSYAWKKMDSIWGGILIHFLFNALILLLQFLPRVQH